MNRATIRDEFMTQFGRGVDICIGHCVACDDLSNRPTTFIVLQLDDLNREGLGNGPLLILVVHPV